MDFQNECEKEECPFCHKYMVIGKQKIMDMCLHIICAECHVFKRADLCPRCVTINQSSNRIRRQIRDENDPGTRT